MVVPAHVVRDHQTTTQLLWNQQAGFLMSGMRRDGWSGSAAEFVWQVLWGLLGAPFQFKESRTWSVVAQLEQGRATTFVRDNDPFQFIEPLDGEIYLSFGPARKWNGREFEPTSARPPKEANAASGVDYSNVNGWSSRINLLNQGDQRFEYTLDLIDGKSVIIADRSDSRRPTLDVVTPDGAKVAIIAVDERFRRVSATEYEVLMRGPSGQRQ